MATIVQQTPFCNIWNNFKLLTTLSWADVATQGCTIGFYPDTSDSWEFNNALTVEGLGVCNNVLGVHPSNFIQTNRYNQAVVGTPGTIGTGGNIGLTNRIRWINYNPSATVGDTTYSTFVASGDMSQIWKSNITRKNASTIAGSTALMQVSVMATVYLKHLHSFFNFVPLLKGVFMKLTLNLNNSRAQIVNTAAASPTLSCIESTSYMGGIQPICIPSSSTGSFLTITGAGAPVISNIYYDLTVGNRTYNPNILTATTVPGENPGGTGNIATSVYLYVPAYTFNPTFEQAYLSNSVKQIKYTDIYQYNFDINVGEQQYNKLITNGIANIKSILLVPYYFGPISTPGGASVVSFMSPFNGDGGGTCAPMTTLTNFNVQISGQNAIYNMQRYNFEEWNNQLYGQNAVNGGLTDGLTSGLINFHDFQQSYAYYYINLERMLPVEQSVPKSIQVLGTSIGTRALKVYVFIEYGVQVSIDVLTGARV